MPSYISPNVQVARLKPTDSASGIEDDPSRRPTLTLIPVPSRESRKFFACAGPCDDQPMTPICLMPSSACGSSGNRSRPPRTMYSSASPTWIHSFLKMLLSKFLFIYRFSQFMHDRFKWHYATSNIPEQ